jgi:hypothetical protein
MIGDEDEGKRDKKVNERENKNVGTSSVQQLNEPRYRNLDVNVLLAPVLGSSILFFSKAKLACMVSNKVCFKDTRFQ